MTSAVPQPESVSDWEISTDKEALPQSILIQQRRYVHLFPYFRMVWVEGDNTRLIINYVSHVVTVVGHGLAPLLSALAAHKVKRIIEPMANEAKFRSGPIITDILVSKNDETDDE